MDPGANLNLIHTNIGVERVEVGNRSLALGGIDLTLAMTLEARLPIHLAERIFSTTTAAAACFGLKLAGVCVGHVRVPFVLTKIIIQIYIAKTRDLSMFKSIPAMQIRLKCLVLMF